MVRKYSKSEIKELTNEIDKEFPQYNITKASIFAKQKQARKEASKNRRLQQKQLEISYAELEIIKQNQSRLLNIFNSSSEIPSSTEIKATVKTEIKIIEDENLDEMLSNCAAKPRLHTYFQSKNHNTHVLGLKYERQIKKYLEDLYYEVEITPMVHDFGIDLIAIKGNYKIAIQCKYWEADAGIDSVQQAFAGRYFYDADHAIVVTNNGFTINAKILADKLNVELLIIK